MEYHILCQKKHIIIIIFLIYKSIFGREMQLKMHISHYPSIQYPPDPLDVPLVVLDGLQKHDVGGMRHIIGRFWFLEVLHADSGHR